MDTATSRLFERLADALEWDALTRMANAPEDGALDACASAEAEIARRGLGAAYIAALISTLDLNVITIQGVMTTGPEEMLTLLTAPPEVRVRAMLRALGVNH